ncbi:MAG: hypothetical protein J0I79_22840 [Mesorhizobium sp.]|uniref:hypothetical protein n=1 Tax=Mesorhizobium sp. TaxID=1871066 RepID=UPI001ACD319D|nr:hypothetical protein [Mesorhizobium sp.]MBN9220793.1 hypothetical protein [Mesorhizobium sp.]
MPWPLLVKAWLPEGVLLGAIAFLAQRTFTNERPSGFAIRSFLFYLTLWLLIWCLTVLAPGLVVAGPLAAQLAPLKDLARIGGLMGAVVGGGLALAFIGLYGALDLGLMLAGAMVAARLAPGMTRLATSLRFGQLDPREASGLKPLLLFGALYWIWSIASGMLFNPDLAAIADPVGGVALLGLCANRLRQAGSDAPNPDIVAPRF